jgi:hypothetical protein
MYHLEIVKGGVLPGVILVFPNDNERVFYWSQKEKENELEESLRGRRWAPSPGVL